MRAKTPRLMIRRLPVLAVVLASCFPKLTVPKEANISCSADRDCPQDEARVCVRRNDSAAGSCVRLVANESPSVVVEPIGRGQADVVSFAVLISDLEADKVATKVTLLAPSLAPIAVLDDVLESSPSGTLHAIDWPVSFPDRSYRSGLVLEVTTSDQSNAAVTTRSAPFAYGNDAPRVSWLAVDDNRAFGLAIVRFSISDSTSDITAVERLELSVAGDFSDTVVLPLDAGQGTHFPSGALRSLATSVGGTAHSVTWDSRLSAPIDVSNARFRMVVTDGDVSEAVLSPPFAIDNAQSAPVISLVSSPEGTVVGGAAMRYFISDADGDLSAITVEYSIDGGPFSPASSANATRLLEPGEHDFVWQTTQLAAGLYTNVVLRLSVSDGSGEGNSVTTAPFTVDTFAAATPVITIDDVDTPALATVDAVFTLRDSNSSLVDASVEYRVSTSGAWHTATMAAGSDALSGVVTSPAGVGRVFRWDALADAQLGGKDLNVQSVQVGPSGPSTNVVAFVGAVYLRVSATDDTSLSAVPAVFGPFAIGNTPPQSSIDDLAGEQGAGVPILFTLADVASDIVSVEIEFRRDSGDTWRRCEILLGNEEGLVTSPTGVEHVVVWNSLAPLNADETLPQGIGSTNHTDVQLRVRALDHPQSGVTHYGPWYVQNSPFSIRNQRPPTIDSVIVTRTDSLSGGGLIDIHYRLLDPDSDPADMRFEISFDGTTWETCPEITRSISEGRYDLATSPTGIEHLFLCDTAGLTFQTVTAARLRLTASDGLSTASTPYEIPLVKVPVSATRPMADGWSQALTQSSRAMMVVDLNADNAMDLVVGDGANLRTFIQQTSTGAALGTYSAGQVFATVGEVLSVKSGDINHDSLADLVVCADGYARVFVSNSGSPGQLGAGPVLTYTPSLCWDAAPADVDEDGIQDLIVLQNGGDILVYRGGGTGGVWDGSFTYAATRATASALRMKVADFNRDGHVDVVVASSSNLTEGALYVVLGNGSLALPAATTISSAPGARYLDSLDVEGDGDLDLVVTCASDPRVALHTNDGSGAFSSPRYFTQRSDARGLALGDFNADGHVDIATTHFDESYVVSLANGEGGFRSAVRFAATGPLVETAAAGDLDGDGVDDLVFSNGARVQTTSSRVRSSSGAFAPAKSLATNGDPDAPLAGDFDSDGVPDLVVTSARLFSLGEIGVFLGNGLHGQARGTFQAERRYFSGNGTVDTKLADFNRDGILDIAVVNPYGSSMVMLLGGGSDGFGDGTFNFSALSSLTQTTDGTITAADLNNDGIPDMVGVSGSSVVSILPAPGSYTPALSYDFGAYVFKLDALDLDGDGNVDLAATVASPGSSLRFAFGRGDFTFDAPVSSGVPSQGNRALLLADFDNDGSLDSLVPQNVTTTPSSVWLLADIAKDGLRNGLDVVSGGGYSINAYPAFGSALGDFNRDGVADAIVTSSDQSSSVMNLLEMSHAGGISAPLGISRSVSFSTESNPREACTYDLNQDGNVDVAVANTASKSVTVHLAQYEGSRSLRQALAPAGARGPARVRFTDADTVPGGLDRFSQPRLFPYVSMSLLPAGSDGGQFVLALRREKPFAVPSRLVPLTHTYELRGDKRLTRVNVPNRGGVRVRVENRFGARTSPGSTSDFDHEGLTSPLVVRLPFLQARSASDIAAASSVRVYARFFDWRRATSVPSDPLNAFQPGDSITLSPDRYLPCRATNGECTKTLVKETHTWSELSQVPDLTNGPGFLVQGRELVIVTDRGGDFQAFVEP